VPSTHRSTTTCTQQLVPNHRFVRTAGTQRSRTSELTLRERERHRVHEISIALELRRVSEIRVDAEGVLSIERQVDLHEVAFSYNSASLRSCRGITRLDEGDQISGDTAHNHLFVVCLVISRAATTQLIDSRCSGDDHRVASR